MAGGSTMSVPRCGPPAGSVMFKLHVSGLETVVAPTVNPQSLELDDLVRVESAVVDESVVLGSGELDARRARSRAALLARVVAQEAGRSLPASAHPDHADPPVAAPGKVQIRTLAEQHDVEPRRRRDGPQRSDDHVDAHRAGFLDHEETAAGTVGRLAEAPQPIEHRLGGPGLEDLDREALALLAVVVDERTLQVGDGRIAEEEMSGGGHGVPPRVDPSSTENHRHATSGCSATQRWSSTPVGSGAGSERG